MRLARNDIIELMEKKLLYFFLIYLVIFFPVAAFTDEIFPFSRFPMYSKNTITPCGFSISDENGAPLPIGRSEKANRISKYIHKLISEKRLKESENVCGFIQDTYLSSNKQDFYLNKYCTDLNYPSSENLKRHVLISCLDISS